MSENHCFLQLFSVRYLRVCAHTRRESVWLQSLPRKVGLLWMFTILFSHHPVLGKWVPRRISQPSKNNAYNNNDRNHIDPTYYGEARYQELATQMFLDLYNQCMRRITFSTLQRINLTLFVKENGRSRTGFSF